MEDKKNKFPAICIVRDENGKFEFIDDRAELPFLVNNSFPDSVFQRLEKISVEDNSFLIAMPNMISLYVDRAEKENKIASDVYLKLKKEDKHENKTDLDKIKNDTSLFFDYISHKSNSLINAFQAIESFCNIAIPSLYEYKKITKTKTEIYTKDQIERQINIEEKLNNILCEIYNLQPIKKAKIWDYFKKMSFLRNELIHLKTSKTKIMTDSLLLSHHINFAEISRITIQYFVDGILSKPKEEIEKYDFGELKKWPQFQNTIAFFDNGSQTSGSNYSELTE